jgi:hypothetical protein
MQQPSRLWRPKGQANLQRSSFDDCGCMCENRSMSFCLVPALADADAVETGGVVQAAASQQASSDARAVSNPSLDPRDVKRERPAQVLCHA